MQKYNKPPLLTRKNKIICWNSMTAEITYAGHTFIYK